MRQEFKVDELYSNIEIQTGLGVGNASGVRVSLDKGSVRRIAVMTSTPSARQAKENPYHDRREGDILVYTGAGLEGEQSLGGVNKRIPQQTGADFAIYGFIQVASRRDASVGPKRWRFLGLLEYLRHYPDTQVDSRGSLRKVWLFEFRVHDEPKVVHVERDGEISSEVLKASRRRNRVTGDDASIAPAVLDPGLGNQEFDPVELEGIRGRLLAKTPESFEHFIKELMLATGYRRASVTRFSQDGGIDVNAYAGPGMWATEDLLIQAQAKRWLHTVGRKEVAELRGSLEPHARGAVVTTSHFLKAAILEAAASGKAPIKLVDGYSLARLAKQAGIHVT